MNFGTDHEPVYENALHGGIQYRYTFTNGYGASVVRHSFSYGGDVGLWELAVLGRDRHITYATPITDDVVGRQTEAEIGALLDQIAALPDAPAKTEFRLASGRGAES